MNFADLFFSFNGRINRGKFWLGMVSLTVLGIICYLGIVAMFGEPFIFAEPEQLTNGADLFTLGSGSSLISYAVLSVISTFLSFALMIKRCHDRGKSGWWSLIALIPLVGFIWLIIDLGVMEGDEGPNQYGPNPLAA